MRFDFDDISKKAAVALKNAAPAPEFPTAMVLPMILSVIKQVAAQTSNEVDALHRSRELLAGSIDSLLDLVGDLEARVKALGG